MDQLRHYLKSKPELKSLVLLTAVLSIICGRLLYQISCNQLSFANLINLSVGGLNSYGCLAGIGIAASVFSYIKHISFWGILDILLTLTIICGSFFRIANYVNGEKLGIFLFQYQFHLPTALIESAYYSVFFVCILKKFFMGHKSPRPSGFISGVILIVFSLTRTIFNTYFYLNIARHEIISSVLIGILGILILIFRRNGQSWHEFGTRRP